MRKKSWIAMTLFLTLFFALPVSPAVYTWKDKDGNIAVSSSPPPGVESQKIGQEKESMRTEEDRAGGKEPAPGVRGRELVPAQSKREAAPADQSRTNREQRSYQNIKVIMYRTAWCPYCRQAEEYLKSLGVTLIEYDIERDRSRAEEMQRKGGGGVPLIDVEGIIIKGYNAGAVTAAVDKRRSGS